ncbi:uncharacterized protein LY79DRAFT_550317 [Colletotrichum navitas]|uniref:Uncharacterized protein n=1 Tax=Colletotrichum navitas TaxID=681940 RepID=A0AAD8V611_9PEZI|nr:uncharacterized protein LY79DRAFT_550317 [Colletotrichum navitas]KAK1593928.1 hypothetical protein LY79DRAFT_550317 [Colletotrichum navitas]
MVRARRPSKGPPPSANRLEVSWYADVAVKRPSLSPAPLIKQYPYTQPHTRAEASHQSGPFFPSAAH